MWFRIGILALLLPLVLTVLSILGDVRSIVSDVRQLTISATTLADDGPQLARMLSYGLSQFADTIERITPERQNEMRKDLERISAKLAPIASGLRPVVDAMGIADEKPPGGTSPITEGNEATIEKGKD